MRQLKSTRCLWLLFIVITGLLVVGAVKLAFNRPTYINNCSEAKARHLTNIPKSSAYYRPELDKNHNGYACES